MNLTGLNEVVKSEVDKILQHEDLEEFQKFIKLISELAVDTGVKLPDGPLAPLFDDKTRLKFIQNITSIYIPAGRALLSSIDPNLRSRFLGLSLRFQALLPKTNPYILIG